MIRVEMPLGCRHVAVPGDLAEDVERDACIRHPREPGVPEVVAPEVLVTELGHHLVPVRDRAIPQH